MAKIRFSTVPDEFLHVAEGAHTYFTMHGFRMAVEVPGIEYPRTPTLIARRGHSTLFVEVSGSVDRGLASAWARYGRSCDSDVQFALAIPNHPGASQSDIEYARSEKMGIYTFDTAGSCLEIIEPVDLALHVELPELHTLPVKVRAVAGPFYKKFERGDWRDGFADACRSVEEISRQYLKSRSQKPGVNILDKKGRPINLTPKQIDKLTLGQLGGYFLGISTPNVTDSTLAKVLPTINPERIVAVHKRNPISAERKLRATAGKRMHAIINCLRELKK